VRPWLTSGRLLPGLTAQRMLTATPAARPLNKTMSAETADNAGTPQSKQFHMVSIKKFPRGIWIRSLATKQRDGVRNERAPGPGLQQAIEETVPHNDIEEASSIKQQAHKVSSFKQQASSPKHKGSSFKPQATSSWIMVPSKSFKHLWSRDSTKINVLLGCRLWNDIWCGENLILFPLHTFSSTVKKWPEVL